MATKLRILIVEDVPNDAELALRELKRAGIVFEARRVETAAEYRFELEEFKPQVILSDVTMANFDGTEALTIARDHFPDIPFIFVSGSISEEHAIRALKHGANDYVMKTNLVRLSSAVERAIAETAERRELRAAEQRLRESEERFRQLAENIAEVFWLTDPYKNEMLYISPAYEAIWGRSFESLYKTPRNWLDAIHPDDRDRVLEAAQTKQLSGGYAEEYRIVRPDGTIRWILDKAFPVSDNNGHIFRIAGIAKDITERKRNEETLRESEYRLNLALEASGLATWEWNLVTGEVRFSRHWWPILGYKPDDIPLRIEAWENLTYADDLVRVKSMVAAVAKGSVPVLEVEYRMQAKNAGWRWIRSVGRVVERDAAGRVVRMTGTHGDITERKRAEQRLLESETKYRGLIEQAADGIFITDIEGNYILVNSRGCELIGYTETELLGLNARDTYIEEEREIHARRIEQVRAGETLRFERMVRRKDGSTFPAEISSKMLDNGLIQVIFHDITARRNQEQKIARLSRIQAVLSGINSAIVRIRDRKEMFHEACRIAVEHGGFSLGWIGVLDQASGKLVPVAQAGMPVDFGAGGDASDHPVALVPMGDAEVALREKRPALDNDIERGLGEMESGFGPDTLSVRRAAVRLGAKSVIVLPLSVEGKTFGILTLYAPERNFFDEQEIKLLNELAGDIAFNLEYIEKQERLHYLAYHDALTGLPNRTLLQDRLGQHLHAAQRNRRMVALILMDLDRFHLVNDTLGRSAGDSLLKEVAVRLQAQVRAEDTVARVGGDSFAVALADVSDSAEVAHFLRHRVSTSLRHPVAAGGQELRLSASFAVALYPSDGATPDTLYTNAEAALKKTKATGEPLLFYSPEMNSRIAESLTLENKLRNALEQEQFVLYYQPKVTVRDQTITGLEALIRWNDPDFGLVSPAKFIPLMEETGLILEAGRWALSQVARDNAIWVAIGIKPPRVAVNVSPIQLRQKNFIDIVVEAAEKAQQAGGMLDLEITESVIMENVEAIIPKLQTMRGLGVEIAVDDFGTGYSSLAYIARLPIHALKIDRSFIVGMTQDEDSLAIVKLVISLAHSLRLKVVAEGVEAEEQAALLLKLGCDEMQGYLFSPPVPPDKVPGLLSQQKNAAIRPARRRSRRSPAR